MKYLHWIIFILLTCIFTALFTDSLSHIPMYHEQHNLFLFSHDYLVKYLSKPGQLIDYISTFIIQFFYLPYIGNLVFALLLSLPYLLNALICRKLTSQTDYLQLALIPSLYLLIRYESIDYPVQHAVGILLCLLCYYLLSWIKGKTKYYLLIPVIAALGLILGWAYPAISLAIVITPCLSGLFLSKYLNSKRARITTLLVLPLYSIATFYLFVISYNMPEHLILQAEKCIKKENWEKAMHYCKRYRGENQLISYFNNLALYHMGEMPYKLFQYPQKMGTLSLYIPWKSDSRQSEYGHYVYEKLGYLNEAHRWAFESMVVVGETAPILDNLIRYNIANERPAVAMRFIQVMKQSLFYRKKAIAYEQIIIENRSLPLKSIEYNENEDIRFANIFNIGPELEYLCDRDSTNKMAFEYLMSYLLLSNKIPRFVENLKRINNFLYPSMPPIYEQALLLYKIKVGEEEFRKLGFTINSQTEERLKKYTSMFQHGTVEEIKQEFGDTYWYYLNFTSPYGNKISEN